jgi:hypothetical protein
VAMIMAFDGETRTTIAKTLGRGRNSVGRKLEKLINTPRYFSVVNAELNKRKKV